MNPGARIDLNCDLGEGEPWERTVALLGSVTSANLACGGHAGDPGTMRAVVRAALARGVRFGAHPGQPGGFGRDGTEIAPGELERLLEAQVGALAAIAAAEGGVPSHVKLHGMLYHRANGDAALAGVLLGFVARRLPGAVVFAPAESRPARLAAEHGVEVLAEGFLDRGYRDDGTLVPRGEPGALLGDAAAVRERLRDWLATGEIVTVTGRRRPLAARTWCVHGDTPGATAIAAAARAELASRERA